MSNITANTTYPQTVSVRDRYKDILTYNLDGSIQLPAHLQPYYRITDFRVPKYEDFFLDTAYLPCLSSISTTPGHALLSDPYLILTRKLVTKELNSLTWSTTAARTYNTPEIVIPHGYIYVAFRPPHQDEYFLDLIDLALAPVVAGSNYTSPRIILKKVDYK